MLKEREGQLQLQAEMEERRRQAQAELGGMAVFGGKVNREKVKKAMEDQELIKATSVVLKEVRASTLRTDGMTLHQTCLTHCRTARPPPAPLTAQFIDQIYRLQFGAAKINPFRQELGEDFFKLYPEYREKCPLPMDLVKMKDKNEGLLYGVDLKR